MTAFTDILATAVVSSLLVGALAWLLKGLIKTRLVASVEHEFNEKIERLRASIKDKQEQIDSVRRTATSVVVNNRQSVDQRRILAIDAVVASVEASKKHLWASSILSRLKVEEIVKQIDQPNMRKFIDGLSPNLEALTSDASINLEAAKAQPYLTISAWAFYKAYVGILSYDYMRLLTLKHGFDPQKFTTDEKLREQVLLALPGMNEFVKKYGASAYHYLLDDLESKLMLELRAIVEGKGEDELAVKRAQAILDAVHSLEVTTDTRRRQELKD